MADAVRLLARVAGYTSDPRRAVVREPEAVDRDTQDRITGAAHRVDTVHGMVRAGERRQQPVAVRIGLARQQAKLTGVDIRPQLFALRRAMETGRSDVAVMRRLEAVERKVFPGGPAVEALWEDNR